jgi:predicted AlkP superfamily phosphohydrolase/phosphomutase
MKLFNYIKASKFFPAYAPEVKQPFNKITGHDGRVPVAFSKEDKKAIREGLRKMVKEVRI